MATSFIFAVIQVERKTVMTTTIKNKIKIYKKCIFSKPIFLKAFHVSTSTTLPSSTNILSTKNVLITTEIVIESLPLSSTNSVSSGENLIYQLSSRGLLDGHSIVITLLKCCLLLFFDWAHFLMELIMVWIILVIGCLPMALNPLALVSFCLLSS